uniref:Krueppel-like factor 3 n=1 Tax=Talaromyces marneffei PM1 TaxID=1077442 RepID=A0A093XKS8_TALMA
MRKERQAGSLDTGIETYRSIEFNLIGDQFKEYRDLDHAGKPLQIPNFGASIEGYTSGFNLNLHDCWNPLQGSSVYHDSKTHDFFDRYSSKRPDRSHTWSGEYSDPGYGSQFGGGTTPSMSVSSFLDSRTEISSIPDDSSSYINGVAIPRQSRTKSLDDNKLRCDKCPWVGKTPSEKRFTKFYFAFFDGLFNLMSSRKHDARHRKAHKCEEDGCESRFGNKNDLERHRKSVHNKCPECGPKETYKCFGRNCGHPEKVWPRLDNFKAHLRLKHYEENETDLLSWSRNWYKERKKEEEGKKREGGIQTTSSCTADVSSRKEPPTTPTITPSTLINTLSYNPGDYFGTELGTLTLNPIGHPQNSRANAFPETLQTLNELPFSPLKADGSSADQVDFKLPSVPDILAEVNPQRRDDLVFRMGPESTPSKGENIENDMKSLMAAHFQAAMADSAAKLIGNVMRVCSIVILNPSGVPYLVTPIPNARNSFFNKKTSWNI